MGLIAIRTILIISVTAGMILMLPRLITALFSIGRIHPVEGAPLRRVAIVFGAGLWRDGSPTPVLRDRVTTAAQLYLNGKVEKILMSGDNRFADYNEPGAMRTYALSLGVPEEDIIMDFAGRRTYDTCYRARAIFGVNDALIVTQRFHLARALFTCTMLDISAQGVTADLRTYRKLSRTYWNLREVPATLVAFIELFLTHPLPVLGEPEPIFPMERSSYEP